MVVSWLFHGCLALLVIFAAALLLRYCRGRRVRKAKRELRVSRLSGIALGAVLLGLQAIVQPESRHNITEQQKEQDTEDGNDVEVRGDAVLRQQLRGIRDGQDESRLRVQSDQSRR